MGKYNTILEYQDAIAVLRDKNLSMLDEAEKMVRSLDEAQLSEFNSTKDEILELENEMKEFEREIQNTNYTKISIDTNMEKKEFSLIRALSDAYNKGEKEVKIDRAFTTAAEGEDVVSVDLVNEVIMPLREEYLFGQVNAKVRTGLAGNPQMPVYTGGTLTNPSDGHVAETGAAAEYTGAFTNITLTPHRISAYTTISKQFLIQAVSSAQDAIIEDLSRQIWDQIELRLLSDSAASEVAPKGLLNGLTAVEVADYKDLVNVEADLRERKYKKVEFVLSPRAEAWGKSTIKGTNNTSMILSDSKMDGIKTTVTSNVEPNQFLLADFSNLIIGFWENPTIAFYDDFQLAQNGLVGIVINAFYDAKMVRNDALVLGEVASA